MLAETRILSDIAGGARRDDMPGGVSAVARA